MAVGAICNHNVATIAADAHIVEAAELMRHIHIGDLVVTESRDGRMVPVGILTDRDIVVEVVAKNSNPRDVTVGDVMSRELLTIHEDNGIEHTLSEMDSRGVRRVPVVDSEGGLVGVLTMDDLVTHLARQLASMAGAIGAEQRKEATSRP